MSIKLNYIGKLKKFLSTWMPINEKIMTIDEKNIDFLLAYKLIRDTNKSLCLTGKAGTGKTTFLKNLQKITNKNTIILAPTGISAMNVRGQTIHSFFKIKPSVYVPNDKRLRVKASLKDTDKSTIFEYFKYHQRKLSIIKELELLVIDEVSMVRCDLIDVIEKILRVFRKREDELFGGVQVLLVGDPFQLAPITKYDERDILKKFYLTEFFFSSRAMTQGNFFHIKLKKIYRQNEKRFINLLDAIRINQVGKNEFDILNSRYNPTFSPNNNLNYITLATHNDIVDRTNEAKLDRLKTKLVEFKAVVTGTFPKEIMPTNKILRLKENSQVMLIKNDKSKRYINGKIAKIKSIYENAIVVELSKDNKIMIEKEIWENIRYKWNEREKKIEAEVIGTFRQFPIKLAWAITVHKSQGLTFEKVIADLGASFTSGQVYVGLSRCTTLDGLVLKTKINSDIIKINPQVLEFEKRETSRELIIKEINTKKLILLQKYKNKIKKQLYRDTFIVLI